MFTALRSPTCDSATPTLTSPPPLFTHPEAALLDGQGNALVVDEGNQSIDVLSPFGRLVTRWRRSDTGPFSDLYGIKLDVTGNVFVADDGAHQIDELSAARELPGVWK